jgi:hypothetical protein
MIITYRLAMPAFLTAVEMALTAVHIELSRVVSSPVPFAFLPSSSTNRVKVTTLVSKEPRSDMTAKIVERRARRVLNDNVDYKSNNEMPDC